MAHYNTQRADLLRFAVRGNGAQGFLGLAGQNGARLTRLRCEADGYSGYCAGQDRAKLEQLAARGGWRFEILRRRGPGSALESAQRRPGVPVGLALFFVVLHFVARFVWAMDFGGLDAAQQARIRTLLAQYQISEGAFLTEETLQGAQQALLLQNEDYGWLSLNFTGGCLFIETTPMQRQGITGTLANTALYAKVGGEVLTTDVQSGFAVVKPGQYVAAGQQLANGIKLDRSGGAVYQPASGRIIARVVQSYTATQPLRATALVLTGERQIHDILRLLGADYPIQQLETQPEPALLQQDWLPLQVGRVALPGCVIRQTYWLQSERTLQYSTQAAEALARRACYLQLKADYPDAVVEQQQAQISAAEDAIGCQTRYIFCANIARQGEATVPEASGED